MKLKYQERKKKPIKVIIMFRLVLLKTHMMVPSKKDFGTIKTEALLLSLRFYIIYKYVYKKSRFC